ncbi:MAG: tRNA (adenosine(37)-N6)-threonylcarbamoyltransferase complex ATPase subunit type 1 TsaE [Deltaproteobacteria bacterium]|nr:MAG: tRNA (adenosine(37)-N6)-threonylcarbamoyltransferase complex ATPase subunit type 1 TsaE [Deltaproteobacteria bacterium]
MPFEVRVKNLEETLALGELIGEAAEDGLVVLLRGDLGAGKTHLTKGIAKGLGVPRPEYVSSPTFTIHKCYEGRLPLNHLDFYRLDEGSDPHELGLEEVLGRAGVSVVEWPDDFLQHLGEDRLLITIEIMEGEGRVFLFDPQGELSLKVASHVGSALSTRE